MNKVSLQGIASRLRARPALQLAITFKNNGIASHLEARLPFSFVMAL
jgi:hypothetical protein